MLINQIVRSGVALYFAIHSLELRVNRHLYLEEQ